MEYLTQFLAGPHIAGRVGYKLAESNCMVLFKGITPWFGSFTLRNVYCLGVVIDNFGIGRWEFILLNGNSQNVQKDELGCRDQIKLLIALEAMIPLSDIEWSTSGGVLQLPACV